MVVADLVAGTAAGGAICLVGHPFDTLKVLMQMQPDRYRSMAAAAKETVRRHGPGGLYKGVGSPLVGNGLYNAVQFAVFARLKNLFTDDGRKLTLNRIAGAAAVTGIFVALVEGPQDLFKSQVQAQMMTAEPAAGAAAGAGTAAKPKYAGTLDCARTILRERGMAGAFQGLGATVARNFVGVCAYFYVYEAMRLSMAGKERPVTALSAWEVLLAGGCGGCVSRTPSTRAGRRVRGCEGARARGAGRGVRASAAKCKNWASLRRP
jgi:solute carrier family 25 carnitine/acylcarnitine transporter 20/29